MRKAINWIKKKGKVLAGIGSIAAILSMAIFPTFSADATTPQFNFMEDDLEFLRGVNATRSETVWKDPVNGDAGDTFEVIAYYHNGRPETTAENTTLKVNVPAQTTNKSAKITASLGADNAVTVTDTVINGNINGLSGLTINLDDDATLAMVPGSVKWYPNRSLDAFSLPFGQSGNEIISANGLNLGDIGGCRPYSGRVVFAVETNPIIIPDLDPAHVVLNKVVRNISDGQSTYVETVDADQNEIVEYQIEIKNTGGEAQLGVNLKDILPQKLDYIDGSATVTRNGVTSQVSANDLFSVGIDLGSLELGDENKIIVVFRAKAPAQIYSPEVLVNHATLVCGLDDTAVVNINPGDVTILKSKSAYNETEDRDATTISAESNDTIVYTLKTTNTGSLGTDVVVEDGIADVLEYADFISASDGGSLIDGLANTNEAKIIKYPSIVINPGVTVERSFTVKVKNPLPEATFAGFHFDDQMYNKYGNEILINILRPTIVLNPDLVIDKVVRNVTADQAIYVEANTADAGDTLEYMIGVSNTGEGLADSVRIYDLLPANVAYDDSFTAKIMIDGEIRDFIGNIADGVTIDELEAGESVYLIFRAKTSTDLASNEHLVNTAYAEDNGERISDTAETVIEDKVVVIETPEKIIVKTLPKTGATTGVIAGLASLVAGLNLIYFKKKKELGLAKRVLNLQA